MANKSLLFIVLLIGLSSCVSESFQKIPPFDLLTDNSSKVWILKHEIVIKKNVTPFHRADKKCFTFYKDKSFVLNKLGKFGTHHYVEGKFQVLNNATQLSLNFKNKENEVYQLTKVSSQELLLTNTKNEIEICLIPLDKPE